MKRKLCIFLSAVILSAGLFSCYASSVVENVSITADGETSTVRTKIINNETYVAARDIFSANDMEIIYEGSTGTLIAAKKKNTIRITESEITLNGETVASGNTLIMSDGTAYIPFSAVSKCLTKAQINENSIVIESSSSDDSWKSNNVSIDLTNETVDGDGAEISDGSVKITKGGDYTLSGSFEGSINVNTDERVRLRLNNADITNSNASAIYVENADKCFIVLEDGTENVISDTNNGNEEMKGAIFSECDLEIKGSGTLTVNGNNVHAIACDDALTIESGNITINAQVKDGIHVNDGIVIKGGNIVINAVGDGIQSEGYIEIEDGTVDITTTGEVTASSGDMPMGGGMGGRGQRMMNEQNGENSDMQRPEMNSENSDMQPPEMNSGNGGMQPPEMSSGNGGMQPPEMNGGNGDMQRSEMNGGNGGMQPPEMNGGNGGMQPPEMNSESTDAQSDSVTEESEASSKGIKAETNIIIRGGDINVNSTDHAMHSADMIIIDDGSVTLSSEVKKGISAHGDVYINGGDIDITKATEGIESKSIMTVNGGNISVIASDDGFNAGGDSDMAFSRNTEVFDKHKININGGNIYIDARGDGIDSNGSITINGGTVIVDGPTSNGDSAIDKESDFIINGGTVVACGSAGMVEMPSESSAQNIIVATFDNVVSTGFTITGPDGTVYEYTPSKEYQNVIFSSPDIETSSSYTITADSDNSLTAEISSSLTTVGNTKSSMGGGMKGGQNGAEGADGEKRGFGRQMMTEQTTEQTTEQ